uniref:Nicotinamide-nucleotide adenylyltransferase n=1 Tax=Crithidia acanthocephali TaxID=59798 RepID=T1YTR3_9TRYP|nr:nicotinamide-nucleotide adenylyltransferase [Crithidia acanthocephali]
MAAASPPPLPPYSLRADKLKLLSTCDTALATSPQPVVLAICGSLNPIHNAHVKLYEAAKAALTSDQQSYAVLGGFFSPVGDAYGKPGLRSAAQRVAIIADAVRDHPDLNVDTWECTQATYTRTFYVLQQLEQHVNAWYTQSEPQAMQQLHAQGRRVRVVFVCGADLFSSFWRPGCWPLHLLKRLLDTFLMVVVYRDVEGEVKSAEDFERVCQTSPALAETAADGRMTELDMRAYHFNFAQFDSPDDTSSTAVREVAVALTEAEEKSGSTTERERLQQQLASMVPASAVATIVEYYGNGGG